MSLYLLRVSLCVRQLGGHMEHYLLIMETCVDGFCPRLAMSDIQPSPKPGEQKEKKRERIWGQMQEKGERTKKGEKK